MLIVPVSAGEIITNGAMTSNLNGWSTSVTKNVGTESGSVSATASGAKFDINIGSTTNGWVEVKIAQTVDVTGTNTISVPYSASSGYWGSSWAYISVKVGSGAESKTYRGSSSGTINYDVSGMSGSQTLEIMLYEGGSGHTATVYIKDVTGTHTRSAPVINSISTDTLPGTVPTTIGYSADITAGNPSAHTWDWRLQYSATGSSYSQVDSSTVPEPLFTIDDAGYYRATLTVDNGYYTHGPVTSSATLASGALPSVSFAATTSTTIAPGGSVTFQSTMSGATSYLWEFGDGTSTSAIQNPTKQYNDAGTYTVKLTGTNEWGSANQTRTDYVSVGSHSIRFNKVIFVSYETATISHTLFDPDFGSHTYEGRFYKLTDGGDLPASPLQTWSITGATAPKEISMSGLAPGNYAAVLVVDGTGVGSIWHQAEINKQSGVYGDVILASAASTNLADAVVTLTGGTNTSVASGAFGVSPINQGTDGVTQAVSVTKTSYVHEDHEITLSGTPTSYNYNMYMLPATYDAGVIRGIVRDADTYQPYAGANVTLGGTASDTTTTNTHGYFEFTGLGAGTYTIDSETTDGYSSEQITGLTNKETVYPKISGLFTITVEVLDTSANPLGSVDVSITQAGSVVGSGTTASTGKVAIGGIPTGTITILLTKTNYVETSESHAVTGSATITMEMLKISESPGMGVQYPPQSLTVIAMDANGLRIPGVNVTATGVESVSTLEWIMQLLGISEQMMIMETVQSGTTDGIGQINFLVVPGIQYRIDATKTGYTWVSKTVYPSSQHVFMTAEGAATTPAFDSVVSITVYGSKLSGNNGRATIQYQDSSSQTNQVNVSVSDRDTGEVIYSGVRTEQTFVQNATISDRGGREIQVTLDIDHATYGSITKDYAITFRGVLVDIGLPEGLYMWFALIMIIIVGAVFTQTTAAIGALSVSFTTAIFWVFGWLNALGNEVLIAIPVMFTIAVIAMIMDARKEEGYR